MSKKSINILSTIMAVKGVGSLEIFQKSTHKLQYKMRDKGIYWKSVKLNVYTNTPALRSEMKIFSPSLLPLPYLGFCIEC